MNGIWYCEEHRETIVQHMFESIITGYDLDDQWLTQNDGQTLHLLFTGVEMFKITQKDFSALWMEARKRFEKWLNN